MMIFVTIEEKDGGELKYVIPKGIEWIDGYGYYRYVVPNGTKMIGRKQVS